MAHQSGLEDLSVKEIMDRWPQTASAFIARRMHCVGCPIGPFHTIADAAAEHQLDAAELLEVIQRDVRAGQAPVRRR